MTLTKEQTEQLIKECPCFEKRCVLLEMLTDSETTRAEDTTFDHPKGSPGGN